MEKNEQTFEMKMTRLEEIVKSLDEEDIDKNTGLILV